MGFYEETIQKRFMYIEENPIILDFIGIKYFVKVLLMLKKKIGLPEYYDENWEALWDYLYGFFFEII